jgi:monoamine oxidase
MRFDPPLPDAKLAALRALRFGQAAKMFVAVEGRPPPSATLDVPGRWWAWTQNGPDGEPTGVAAAFAGTAGAVERLAGTRDPSAWLAELRELRPDLQPARGEALLCTWHDDQWAGRCSYSASSHSSRPDPDALAAPVGPLAFAGEYTAGEWHALMEGALRSGARAAAQVLGDAGTA